MEPVKKLISITEKVMKKILQYIWVYRIVFLTSQMAEKQLKK